MTDLAPVSPAPDLFTVAVLKGAVEGDVAKHFASFGALDWHIATARALGLVAEDETATDYGRELYQRHALCDLPAGRAYLAWINSAVVDAIVAELRSPQ